MFLKNISFILISLLINSCAGIKMLTDKDLYSEEFLKKMDTISTIYKDGDKASALKRLNQMDDLKLSDNEKAKKYNLIGIISFSQANYEFATKRFREASAYVKDDYKLRSQVNLNLASTLYKQEQIDEPAKILQSTNISYLSEPEKIKFHKLNLVIFMKKEDPKQVLHSLVYLMKDNKTFAEVNSSEYKNLLIDTYKSLNTSDRVYLLEKYEDSENINIAYLGTIEAKSRFYLGEKDQAMSMVSWINSNFDKFEDVKNFVKDFEDRIESFSKIDTSAIGVILPLSGEQDKFGHKALVGLETALSNIPNQSLKLLTRDNQNNKALARKVVRELIENNHVSAIIGGLYPNTAKDEYLEAKKYGVLFISLSQVFLEKQEKNHLLIEVPGSIQSQVATLFSSKFLDKYGRKVAMLYPETEGGESYLNEVWRTAEENNVELKSIYSYDTDTSDYRLWVKKTLGLEYKRERSEEFELWKKIYSLEKKKTTIRRIQTLKPVIDFDWIFVPSYPGEAVQIIPTFKYFDAANLQFVGGPSWMSRKLVKDNRGLGAKVALVGNSPEKISTEIGQKFQQRNNSRAGLIEALSYDALSILNELSINKETKDRSDLAVKLKTLPQIKGLTGEWVLKDNIWIKNMDILAIKGKSIVNVELD